MDNSYIEEVILPLHRKLTKRIKEYELITREFPPLETLNEIRYALRATMILLKMEVSDRSENQIREELLYDRITHALLCGYHDLVDGLLHDIINILHIYTEKYGAVYFDVIGNEKRIEINSKLKEIMEDVSSSRGDDVSRKKVYDERIYDNYYKTLLEYREYFTDVALPEIVKRENKTRKIIREKDEENSSLNKVIEHLNAEKKSQQKKYLITVAFAILGLIFAIAGFFL